MVVEAEELVNVVGTEREEKREKKRLIFIDKEI